MPLMYVPMPMNCNPVLLKLPLLLLRLIKRVHPCSGETAPVTVRIEKSKGGKSGKPVRFPLFRL